MATDAELLSAWRRGDGEAFAALYARHRRCVYLCILAAVGDADTAEDLLQETFLKVFRHGLASRNGHASIAPYLATVGRNLAADWRRREARGARACAQVARFLEAAWRYLTPGGRVYVILSSLGSVRSVLRAAKERYDIEMLEEKHLFFESILAYRMSAKKSAP